MEWSVRAPWKGRSSIPCYEHYYLHSTYLHSFCIPSPHWFNKIAYCYNRYKTKKGDSGLNPLLGFGIMPAHPCSWCL
jgi:hypothetical protein